MAAEEIAGLKLKGKKCMLVPVGGPFRAQLVALVRDWLCCALPAWSSFQIADKVKYLGFWLGPAVTDERFEVPLAKFVARANRIARSALAPTAAVKNFNTRAASVLGYVAQLAIPGLSDVVWPVLVLGAGVVLLVSATRRP